MLDDLILIETDRLTLTDWTAALAVVADRDDLCATLGKLLTPPVLKPLPASMQLSDGPAAIADWVSARQAESKVMTVNSDGVVVGLLILVEITDPSDQITIHLGYLFCEKVWGRGFATEMLVELVEWFGNHRPDITLTGGVERGNAASARVLEKAGFKSVKSRPDDRSEVFTLVAKAP